MQVGGLSRKGRTCSWLLGTNHCTYSDSLSYFGGKLTFNCRLFNTVLVQLSGCAVCLMSHSVMLGRAIRLAGGTQMREVADV